MKNSSKFYYYANKEVENKTYNIDLWRKALALMGGNEVKAKEKYIKLRIIQMKRDGYTEPKNNTYDENNKTNKKNTNTSTKKEPNNTKTLIGIFVFIIFFVTIVIISQSNKESIKPVTNNTHHQVIEKSTVSTIDKINTPADNTSKNENIDKYIEMKPSKSSSSALNMNELRYCLSEQIRLDSVKNIINDYFQEDIDRYNGLVNDYNNRCKNRKYYETAFTKANKEVNDREYTIKKDGLNRFPKPSEAYHESKPSSYTSSSLTRNELRYCMAENIRLDTIKNKINNYSNYEIDKYNRLSDEYNKLCQNTKYYINDQKYVQKQIDARKSIIQQEGINRFWKKKQTKKHVKIKKKITKFSLTIKPTPGTARVQIMNIKPKYYDGIKLKKGKYHMRVSKKGYTTVKQWIVLKKDEYFTITLNKKQNKVSNTKNLNLSQLTYAEKSSIQSACIMEKQKGPARYNRCLKKQMRSHTR